MKNKKNQKNNKFFFVFLFILFFPINKNAISQNANYTSAIVVDAKNGEILYSYNPDVKIYPASLTKMMTAYVVFTALKNENIGINDKLSKYNITINDLIYKMSVKSDNKAPILLAEEIAGSVYNFVENMNKTASAMNLKNTHFANVNGLFDENNYSTARDMVKLSIRLIYDFPQYTDFFGTTNYIDEKGNYNIKTSQIQENIEGIEGGKTGYLDASGNNFAVWGNYNDKHIFIVIIGAKSKIHRDNTIVQLLSQVLKYNKTLVRQKKEPIDQRIINDFFNFIDFDYQKYTTPQPVLRDNTISVSKSKTNYFYKK